MMTRDEFIEVVGELLEDYGYAYMNRQEARSVSIDSWARDAQERMDTAEDGLLATYDEMAARIAELEAQVAAMDREMKSMAATSDGFQMDAMFARERINALVLRVILDSRVVLHRGAIQRAHDLLDGGEE